MDRNNEHTYINTDYQQEHHRYVVVHARASRL
jgi:hypothetical protein